MRNYKKNHYFPDWLDTDNDPAYKAFNERNKLSVLDTFIVAVVALGIVAAIILSL